MEWEALAEAFYDYLSEIRGYSDHTVKSYAIALSAMLETMETEQTGEKTWVWDITPFRMRIASLSKKSIALKLSAVRRFAAFVETHRKVTIILRGDSAIKVPQTLPKPIEPAYIAEALESASPKERLAAGMLYGLGLRIGELAALRPEDIRGTWVEVHGKGGKVRHVPLPKGLKRWLDEYLSVCTPRRYLFEKGNAPMNDAQLRYMIQTMFRRCGIKATPHQLRHSFATHLLNEGARIADVSELLGHSSMATTQIYTKLSGTKKMQEYLKAHPLANK
jgi:integrase/recombinase XerC